MKGIVLAGGSGTRLYPITQGVETAVTRLRQTYDFYPISVLMLAGIRDILIITTPEDMPSFQRLLGNGEQFGIRLSYEVQPSPDGSLRLLSSAKSSLTMNLVRWYSVTISILVRVLVKN